MNGAEKERCKETVYPNDQYGIFHGHQCTRFVWKDGHCKTHHPETVAARQAKSAKRYKEKWDNSPTMQLHRSLETIKQLQSQIAECRKETARECADYIESDGLGKCVTALAGKALAQEIRQKFGVD